MTGSHQVFSVGVKLTASQSAQPGRYTGYVDAFKSDNTSARAYFTINVLPAPMDTSTTAPCAAFTTAMGTTDVVPGPSSGGAVVATDPMKAAMRMVFGSKDANPSKTVWEIGYFQAPDAAGQSTAGQHIVLSKPFASLSSTQAIFYFHNPTRTNKQYVLFNSKTCGAAAIVLLQPGESATILGDAATMNTILFRRDDGKGNWQSISLLSEQPFWTLFGGKEVDMTWIEMYG
jgi:hypothetical protein